jgi:hypothetical protein
MKTQTGKTDIEARLDALDPATTPAKDAHDLREIARLADQRHEIDETLTKRIAGARDRGWSWSKIAIALGVSRQAARQRYGDTGGTDSNT